MTRPECKDCFYHRRVYKKEKGCAYYLMENKMRSFDNGLCTSRLVLDKQATDAKLREYKEKIFSGK